MPRVFRQQYTRPLPDGAERVTATVKRGGATVEVPAVRFKGDDGKQVIAPLVLAVLRKGDDGKRALMPIKGEPTHCRVASPTWYGKVKGKAVPLCSNKSAA